MSSQDGDEKKLRRSSSGTFLRRTLSRSSTNAPTDCWLTLHLQQRTLRLIANSSVVALWWVDMFNAACMLGLNLRACEGRSTGHVAPDSKCILAAAELARSSTPSEWSQASQSTAEGSYSRSLPDVSEPMDGTPEAQPEAEVVSELGEAQSEAEAWPREVSPAPAQRDTAQSDGAIDLAMGGPEMAPSLSDLSQDLPQHEAISVVARDALAPSREEPEPDVAEKTAKQFDAAVSTVVEQPSDAESNRGRSTDQPSDVLVSEVRCESDTADKPSELSEDSGSRQEHVEKAARVAADLELTRPASRPTQRSASTQEQDASNEQAAADVAAQRDSMSRKSCRTRRSASQPAGKMSGEERIAADIALLNRPAANRHGKLMSSRRKSSQADLPEQSVLET